MNHSHLSDLKQKAHNILQKEKQTHEEALMQKMNMSLKDLELKLQECTKNVVTTIENDMQKIENSSKLQTKSSMKIFIFNLVLSMSLIMGFFLIIDMNFSGIVSKYIGELALAATTVVFPFVAIVLGIAIMYTTGANAIISANLGAGEHTKAKENFTRITIVGELTGIIIAIIAILFKTQIVTILWQKVLEL